jgi:hypothetical protein
MFSRNTVLPVSPSSEQLKEELHKAKQKIGLLEKKIDFLTKHSDVLFAKKWENVICEALGGRLQTYGRSFDIKKGLCKLEVKSSRLYLAVKGQITERWVWNNLLGLSNKKHYNYLVLVAEKKDGTYFCFFIPREEVPMLMNKGPHGGTISLTTNPVRSEKSKKLQEYRCNLEQIEAQFKIVSRDIAA